MLTLGASEPAVLLSAIEARTPRGTRAERRDDLRRAGFCAAGVAWPAKKGERVPDREGARAPGRAAVRDAQPPAMAAIALAPALLSLFFS